MKKILLPLLLCCTVIQAVDLHMGDYNSTTVQVNTDGKLDIYMANGNGWALPGGAFPRSIPDLGPNASATAKGFGNLTNSNVNSPNHEENWVIHISNITQGGTLNFSGNGVLTKTVPHRGQFNILAPVKFAITVKTIAESTAEGTLSTVKQMEDIAAKAGKK